MKNKKIFESFHDFVEGVSVEEEILNWYDLDRENHFATYQGKPFDELNFGMTGEFYYTKTRFFFHPHESEKVFEVNKEDVYVGIDEEE